MPAAARLHDMMNMTKSVECKSRRHTLLVDHIDLALAREWTLADHWKEIEQDFLERLRNTERFTPAGGEPGLPAETLITALQLQ